jgi:iron complex transport system substrate-binding protein
MRVVALLPAATEIVCALGASDRLAGITHECDDPGSPRRIPRVTRSAITAGAAAARVDAEVRERSAAGASVFELDEDTIASLAPDLLITQALCDVCAVSEGDVRALAARLPHAPPVLTLSATTIDGVFADIGRIGDALGLPDEALELELGLRHRLRRVHETLKRARAPRPRVAVIEWTDPVFVAGHWVPEMVRRAGGVDVMARAGTHSVTSSAAGIGETDPECLLVAPCGCPLDRASVEARALLARDEWQWARGRAVWAVDANAFTSRPGPRVVAGVEVIARILHPTLFSPLDSGAAVRVA